MNLAIPDTVFVLALVMLAHAWTTKMTVTQNVANALGWTLNILAILALIAIWLR